MANRQAVIAQAVRVPPRVATGGTSAPKSAGPRKPQGGGPSGGTTAPAPGGGNKNKQQPNPNQPNAPKPGTPGATPLPWDSNYELAVGGARNKYNSALINAGYAQTAAQQEYGLDPGFNDYKANPYSRAALLEQSYLKANRGSNTSYAAQGQLYAGSLSNALDANRSAYGQSRDSLEKAYRDALHEIDERRTNARNEMNDEIAQAGWDRVTSASGADLEPETSPEGKKSGAKSNKNSKPNNQGKNKKGKK